MLNERSKQIRRDTIKLSKANGGYHFGGCFSVTEILIVLFDKLLESKKDKFILSKGHACWPLYVILREKGLNPKLEGHPYRDVANGIECTTGSMGHGFPTAVGMAMAKKIKKEEGIVYVIVGDGECQEGTTWESLLIAAQHNLDNLVVIVDNNGIQGSGYTKNILNMEMLKDVVTKIGWKCLATDGHSLGALENSLKEKTKKPLFIIAKTVKGKGVSFMEDSPKWHACWLDDKKEILAMEELS